ncbi:MAG: hypothetical protein U5L05_12785 [Rubrivivax sp.]|nr:hypothetical protein [Rubrivivax sp.]
MSAQSAKISVPSPAVHPQAPAWAPVLLARLARIGRAAWRELEVIGQARANRELQRMAQLHAHDPELAQALLDARRRASQRG